MHRYDRDDEAGLGEPQLASQRATRRRRGGDAAATQQQRLRCMGAAAREHKRRRRLPLLATDPHAFLPKPPHRNTTQAAAGSGAGSGGSGRHAVLHDFCMGLPYGALAAAAGLGSLLFGAGALGWQVAAAGAAVLAASALSLRAWRGGGPHAAFTLASAGAAGWVAAAMWARVAAGVTPVASALLLAPSAALALFCVYNVLAGGNPPPSGGKAKPAAA